MWILQINPYESTKGIAKDVITDPKTVKRILIEELGMIKVNCKWIQHILTLDIKAKRLLMAKELFQFLTDTSEHKLYIILTQNGSWFYLINQSNSMWLKV